MTAAIQKLEKGTIELTISIPWATVKTHYDQAVDEAVTNAELPGFRKGKAPRNLVIEKLDKSKTYEEMLQKLIPEVYNAAIKDHNLHPIIMPKVELKEAEEEKDWKLRVLTCEKPAITLGDYKKAISELNSNKAKKIWTPGAEPKAEADEKSHKPTMDELLKTLFDAVKAEIPDLLLENEVNRLLSELIDQTKKLGLSVEQYLASTKRTQDSVRAEYTEQAQKTISLEFALEEIADQEGILVSDDDLDNVIKTAKTDDERRALENQRYYLASVLRRQKTIDFLATL